MQKRNVREQFAGWLVVLLLMYFFWTCCCARMKAQNTNPQSSFAAQVSSANPTTNITFNNPAQLFRENTTGVNFIAGYSATSGALNGTYAGGMSSGSVWCLSTPLAAVPVNSISMLFYAAPTAGNVTVYLANQTLPSITLVSSFVLAASATAGVQTWTAGTGFTAFTPAAGQVLCVGGNSTTQPGYTTVVGTNYLYKFTGTTPAIGTATTFTLDSAHTPGIAFSQGTSSILSGQSGFDSSQQNNTAASFPYNGFIYAPNNALGDHEWSQPWGMMFQVDRLNWPRTGTWVLASKGNLGSSSVPSWKLYMNVNGSYTQFCYQEVGAVGGSNQINQSVCSVGVYDLPNGYNYSVYVTNDGTGQPVTGQSSGALTAGAGINIYVNGTQNTATGYANVGRSWGAFSATGSGGTGYTTGEQFGVVAGSCGAHCRGYGTITATSGAITGVTLTSYTNVYGATSTPTLAIYPYFPTISGGSGYAASTAFTSTGGGTGCALTGTFASSGGVPTGVVTVTNNTTLCTSAPTLVMTAPTGTGATFVASAQAGSGGILTATLNGASLSTATTAPMYVNGGWSQGAATATWNAASSFGGDTAAPGYSMLSDQFATFPATPNVTQILSTFYQTKWYQGLLNAVPAVPYTVIYDNDGTGDPDDIAALSETIAAVKLGYIHLAAAGVSTNDGTALALYRNMLDSAGLGHIPVCRPSSYTVSTSTSSSASSPIYNASTPQTTSAYPMCGPIYRQILANNTTKPVVILLAGGFRSVADWMGSAADSISPLTGLQQVAQNATNGGAIYCQGLSANSTFTSDNSLQDWTAGQYVVNNNGAMPIYWFGGSPQSTGPGVLSTRNAKDPYYLYDLYNGSDVRAGFDSLPTINFLSSVFSRGVTIAITAGGSGYAATQAFTSTGGGPSCSVSGTITAVSGVLTTANYPNVTYPTYFGFGSGCTSAPTIVLTAPTGTGAVLTATALHVCGTVTITGATAGSTSTSTCSNHYFDNPANTTASSTTPIMNWFTNALIDPPPNGAPRTQ